MAISHRLLLFILVFAPLAFGSVEHWSIFTVEILVPAALLVCLLELRRAHEPFLKVPGILPLLLFSGLMLLQLVPLPAEILKYISPQSWNGYEPIVNGTTGWAPLTLDRQATLQELLRMGSYLCFYVLTVQLLRNGDRIKRTVTFIVVLAVCIAILGILQKYNAEDKIFWFRPAPSSVPGGPWVYRNHYSAFLEAIIPLSLGLFLFYRPTISSDSSLRQRVVSLFSSPRSNLHILLGFAFVIMVTAVFVNLSRGGIIATLFSIVIFSLLVSYTRRNFQKFTLWGAAGLILIGISWFGWQPILDRFDSGFLPDGTIREGRLQVWQDSLEMAVDFPVFGAGFSTYMDVYPSYKTVKNDLIFDHAHNEFIEMLSDSGIVGFSLIAWFCLSIVLYGWRMIRKRRNSYALLVGVGSLAGIAVLLLHALVDFVFHNYTIGLLFFFLCGLFVSISHTRCHYHDSGSLLPSLPDRVFVPTAAAVTALLVLVVLVQGGRTISQASYRKIQNVYLSSHLSDEKRAESVEHLERAMTFAPLDGKYPYVRAQLAELSDDSEAAQRLYRKAARCQPMEGAYLQRLGLALLGENPDEAISLILEGYRRALNKDQLALATFEILLQNNRRGQAKQLLRQRFEVESSQLSEALVVMETHGFGLDEMGEVLPRSVPAWIRYGALMERLGRVEDAEFFRKRALDYLVYEETVNPSWYSQLISYYNRIKQPEKALIVLRQAAEQMPDHGPFHIQLGDYYRAEGITYRAAQEYRQAVTIEPRNKVYQDRLKTVEKN